MAKILFVTKSNWMMELGAGGRHRGYQIQYDLESLVGKDNLGVLTPGHAVLEAEAKFDRRKGGWRLRRIIEQARLVSENPLRLLSPSCYADWQAVTAGFVADYRRMIAAEFRPDVVVLEDPRFAPLLAINRAAGIPTVICPHKFEALPTDGALSPAGLRTHLLDFAREVEMLRRCEARLFISKVEAGFMHGLGSESHFYPYAPRGELAARWENIYAQRQRSAAPRAIFLLVGRASFAPTRRAFEWLLRAAAQSPLPGELHIIGTDKGVLPDVPGVVQHGYIDHAAFDALLLRARAALLPLTAGFGVPTRLADFAHAGVPVVASAEIARLTDVPSNTTLVENDWTAWRAALETVEDVPDAAYRVWLENSRESALVDVVRRWL